MQGVQWLEGLKKDIPEEIYEQVLKDEQEFTRQKKMREKYSRQRE